jgi:hypothetical protein
LLLDASGKPLVTEDLASARKKRVEALWQEMLVFLNDHEVTVDELADLTANYWNTWCLQCAAGLFEEQANMMMNHFLRIAQTHGPVKAGELKIRNQLASANKGLGEKQ